MTVELAITPDHRWRFGAGQLVHSAARAGFAACGIGAEAVDAAALAAYAAAGIRCHEVLALFIGDDEEAAAARAAELGTAAATIGAPWVLTVFATPALRPLRRCAGVLAAAGVGMAVEFSPLGPVSSIRNGIEMVRVARDAGGRAGVMIDSWHFCFGDSTWTDLEQTELQDILFPGLRTVR